MNEKVKVQKQVKTTAASQTRHAVQRLAMPEQVAERLDIATQLTGAARLGHSLEAIRVERKAAPSPNLTGLPDNLKAGVENLSGLSLDNVRVHYNSSQPAAMQALAFARGTEIHVGPGQERHLPHEAWHVVQQAQVRVRPTLRLKSGTPVNDDNGLEHEADVMGARALAAAPQFRDLADQQVLRGGFAPTQRAVSTLAATHSDRPVGVSYGQLGVLAQNKRALNISTTPLNCVQGIWNQEALNNITAARDILARARNHYVAFDHALDGNRVNWGYSVPTWNTLLNNVTIKSNHMRGQGTADALESMSWEVGNHAPTVRGPGGGAGVDLRLYSAAGVGANRMDIEVKHASSVASIRDQIDTAVIAHDRNQTIKVYVKNPADIPGYGANWVRAGVLYTVRTELDQTDNNNVFVNFYRDTNPAVRLARRKVGWP